MKSLKTLLTAAVMLLPAGVLPLQAGERFRTDINPALLYWQAWGAMPTLSEPDHGYLFTNEWRGQRLEARFGELLRQYDNSFKLLRRAAKARVPCEWGCDLSDGPEAILPGLAKAKAVVQTARLRVMWHLQNSEQAAARDDLLAAFVLGRNLATDGILISALVQIAIENICGSIIAENFSRFSPETLQEILAGIDASPARGTMVRCVATERESFAGWLIRKLEDFRAESPDDPQVMERMRKLFQNVLTHPEQPDPQLGDKVFQAAGGTSAGLIRYVKELWPLYDEVAGILAMPYQDSLSRWKAFDEKVKSHPNLLVKEFFAAFEKCRKRECGAELKLAMVHAAVAYRVAGEAGLQRVKDPVAKEPFQVRRFVFDGVDRGFELKSNVNWRGFEETLIFVEKDGPLFYLHGPSAGKKVE
jgi:hypothetical protein